MFINIHEEVSLFVSLLDGRGGRFKQIMFVLSPYWIPWVVKLSFYPGLSVFDFVERHRQQLPNN